MSGDELIGSSAAIERIRTLIRQAASCDAGVLITGEAGSGKALAARAIHRWSARSAGPFVELNCAAIPDTLIESELFGHTKGAFTGALASRKGRFEAASGGTIFLDEIGDMSLSAQSKILRAIQDHIIEPLGGEASFAVDVRILAASNKDLKQECAEGRFREDLFFRLNVLPIHMPPLRERREDIIPLFRYFLDRAGGAGLALEEGAEAYLTACPWPGNIRELQNLASRVVLMGGAKPEDLRRLISGIPGKTAPPRSKASRQRAAGNRTADHHSGGLPPEILNADYETAQKIFEKRYLEFQFFKNRCIIANMAKNTGLDAGILGARLKHYKINPQGI